jgi:Zn-dependent protease with chaperone function
MLKLVETLFSLVPVRAGLALIVLCAPIVLTVIFRSLALRAPENGRQIWFAYRQNSRLVFFATIGGWWALWDWSQPFLLSDRVRSLWPAFSDPAIREMVFCLLPLITFAIAQTVAYFTDKSVYDLHWSRMAILRQGFWSLIRHVAPLLFISAAFEEIFDGELLGTVWLVCAFMVFVIGKISHDKAMGINSRLLKSGEIRNRSMAVAEKMNVDLRRVYVVPQGKGHLLNAFAGFGGISLTDTLSQRLNRAEVDCTIAHELGHLKLGHAPKSLVVLFSAFAFPALLFFGWPLRVPAIRPALDFFVIFAPFLVFYFFSRRFEYQADRESALRNPEIEISSLIKVHHAVEVPFKVNVLTEMFLTHPSLMHRVAAIARNSGISETRVEEMLWKGGLRKKAPTKTLDAASP